MGFRRSKICRKATTPATDWWLDVSRDVCKRGGIDQESCMSACSRQKVSALQSGVAEWQLCSYEHGSLLKKSKSVRKASLCETMGVLSSLSGLSNPGGVPV